MALAELLKSLSEEADAQVRELLADARASAERLRADEAADLARRCAGVRDAREAARSLLEGRAVVLERIRRGTAARLAGRASDPAGVPRLARELALALEYLGPVPAIAEVPAPLLDALRGSLPDPSQVTFEPSDGPHGLAVRTADGALRVDASVEHRLARAWPRLAIALARRLDALP